MVFPTKFSPTARGAIGDEEDDDGESIFSLAVDPAPPRAVAPVTRAVQAPSLTPTTAPMGGGAQSMTLTRATDDDAPSSIGGSTKKGQF